MSSGIVSRLLSSTAAAFDSRIIGQAATALTGKAAVLKNDAQESHFYPTLIDTFGRRHNYLRISLTEKCNLRCFYCMPENGVELSPKAHILADDEVIRLASLFVRRGVTKIRLTGGEPTVRKNLVELVGRLNELRALGLRSIGITSNGIALHRKLSALVDNGLTHLNLSLDTLDPQKFQLITRRTGHDAVLKSLMTSLDSPGIEAVKLNVVVMRGINEDEVLDFVGLTKELNIAVRFIEFMPFSGNKWSHNKMVPSADLLRRISERWPETEAVYPGEPNGTARMHRIPGYSGSFGFISSMSDHFCGTCNRLRITADGMIKVCLFDPKEVSLRDIMRSGGSDGDLETAIGLSVKDKKAKHAGMENIDVVHNRPMILIGESDVLGLTHMDESGKPRMVDVGGKAITSRLAVATGSIIIPAHALDLVTPHTPDLSTSSFVRRHSRCAQLAGIMAAKATSSLIPLCHPLPLTCISVNLLPVPDELKIVSEARVSCDGKTGVEMEPYCCISVAGKEMIISDIKVVHKSGGKSGDWTRPH
ncbi:uncharacterized protein EI90DRAFT_3145710 [Cantharellus anzutake]|uniref:uncharacterized protein n=1 Tax=Cantharellus anzutake TaxID=1750568 RepID=UPI001907A006|nr:uncharacterized protein EI90DRAFT_3145710 [Cantharellus anzutake]KAF8330794.1 hypothetical protein EI90DRAFT_3145710 [Cantharellus anzutake]